MYIREGIRIGNVATNRGEIDSIALFRPIAPFPNKKFVV
jgi:hypothetical protein